jgi:hypothetical protein
MLPSFLRETRASRYTRQSSRTEIAAAIRFFPEYAWQRRGRERYEQANALGRHTQQFV